MGEEKGKKEKKSKDKGKKERSRWPGKKKLPFTFAILMLIKGY